MQPWISRNLFYYPVVALRGEPVVECRRRIREFERLTPESMTAWQQSRLAELVRDAATQSAYYRELFQSHGIDPTQELATADFERIPFLTKEIIQAESTRMIGPTHGRVSVRKTSGSTGTPLVLVKDRRAEAVMDAYMYEVYGWYGIDVGTRQARIWGIPLGRKARMMARLKDRLLNRRRMVAFEINREYSRAFYHELLRFRPYFLYGLINPIHEFCRELVEAGLDPKAIGLQLVITTGERQVAAKKAYISEHFGCRVVDEYGCTESGIIAFECPEGNRHIAGYNLYVEIIDPATGEVVRDGESGEVVITELHARAMPIIRYRVGDLARISHQPCPCGRTTPVIIDIVGRVSELIITPEGKRVAAAVLDYSVPAQFSRFRAIQHAVDRMTLLLEGGGDLPGRAVEEIRAKLVPYLGDRMQLEIQVVERIPLDTSGKLRCFVSELEGGMYKETSSGH